MHRPKNYSYGAQLGGILRIGENDQDYTLGNKFEAALWGARKITDSLSASAKFDYSSQSEIDGSDERLKMRRVMMDSPTFDPNSQGRDITTFGLGLNYYFQNGGLSGHRLAAEWEIPIDQKVNEYNSNSIQFGHLVGNTLGRHFTLLRIVVCISV